MLFMTGKCNFFHFFKQQLMQQNYAVMPTEGCMECAWEEMAGKPHEHIHSKFESTFSHKGIYD